MQDCISQNVNMIRLCHGLGEEWAYIRSTGAYNRFPSLNYSEIFHD